MQWETRGLPPWLNFQPSLPPLRVIIQPVGISWCEGEVGAVETTPAHRSRRSSCSGSGCSLPAMGSLSSLHMDPRLYFIVFPPDESQASTGPHLPLLDFPSLLKLGSILLQSLSPKRIFEMTFHSLLFSLSPLLLCWWGMLCLHADSDSPSANPGRVPSSLNL